MSTVIVFLLLYVLPPPQLRPPAARDKEPAVAGDTEHFLAHDGRQRRYLLHVPPQHDGRTRRPLVIMLHGGGGNADGAARFYGWNEKSDAEGFYVVYPEGVGRIHTWNAVHCCGEAHRENVDDVGFMATLIEELRRTLPIDERRVCVTGMSNGGMMAHRLAAERPELFAAIAPVAASVGGRMTPHHPVRLPHKPKLPVPVMIVHGVDDQHVMYAGGKTKEGFMRNRVDVSVEESAQFWVAANGCEESPREEPMDSGAAIRRTYAARNGGAEVVVISVPGQGHAWPGGRKPRPKADEPSPAVHATDLIWAFFERHARR